MAPTLIYHSSKIKCGCYPPSDEGMVGAVWCTTKGRKLKLCLLNIMKQLGVSMQLVSWLVFKVFCFVHKFFFPLLSSLEQTDLCFIDWFLQVFPRGFSSDLWSCNTKLGVQYWFQFLVHKMKITEKSTLLAVLEPSQECLWAGQIMARLMWLVQVCGSYHAKGVPEMILYNTPNMNGSYASMNDPQLHAQ